MPRRKPALAELRRIGGRWQVSKVALKFHSGIWDAGGDLALCGRHLLIRMSTVDFFSERALDIERSGQYINRTTRTAAKVSIKVPIIPRL
jgi:hypothetical protein